MLRDEHPQADPPGATGSSCHLGLHRGGQAPSSSSTRTWLAGSCASAPPAGVESPPGAMPVPGRAPRPDVTRTVSPTRRSSIVSGSCRAMVVVPSTSTVLDVSGSWNPEPPFSWRMPATTKGTPPILDLLTHARGVEAQVVRGRGTHHGDAQRVGDSEIGEPGFLPDLEAAHRRVVRRGAQDGGRRVGVTSGDELRGGDLPARPRPARRGPREPRRPPRVSVSADPAAPNVPAACVDPGLTVNRFVPSPARRSVMLAVEPWPTATSATTEATPMMTPSIVRAVRRRLVPSRLSASAMRSRTFMPAPARPGGGPVGTRGWRPPPRG